jgi:hypothetical protein
MRWAVPLLGCLSLASAGCSSQAARLRPLADAGAGGGGTATSSSGSSSGTTTAGPTTTSGGSTGSSSTGGSSSGGNAPDAGCSDLISVNPYQEFFPCLSSADCTCPFLCAGDPGLYRSSTGCEQPCVITADCWNPATHCVNGFCNVNTCNERQGSMSCDALDAGDGTCEPDVFEGTNEQWDCMRAGTAISYCEWPSAGSTESTTCPSGTICVNFIMDDAFPPVAARWEWSLPASGQCLPVCNPTGSTGPACQGLCELVVMDYLHEKDFYCPTCTGACVDSGRTPPQPSYEPWLQLEYGPCNSDADCISPLSCRDSVALGVRSCLATCTLDSDCPLFGESCDDGGVCGLSPCLPSLSDGGTTDGPVGDICPLPGGIGTCLPLTSAAALACLAGGTASGDCAVWLPNGRPDLACPVGQTCVSSRCYSVCDPNSQTPSCDSGTACASATGWNTPMVGICTGGCLPSGLSCIFNGDCCSRFCGPSDGGTCS